MTSNKLTESMAHAFMLDSEIATAAGGCPCKIEHIMPEILRGAKTIILNRLRMPSPKRMAVYPDGHEEVLR